MSPTAGGFPISLGWVLSHALRDSLTGYGGRMVVGIGPAVGASPSLHLIYLH